MKETEKIIMDYERIDKRPQQGNGGGGGGLSPRKLRSMILGAEKRRNLDHEEDDEDEQHYLDSTFSLRSQLSHVDHSAGCSCSENCKDVDVGSVLPECSTSTTAASMTMEMVSDSSRRDHSLLVSRIRPQDESYLDDDSEVDSVNVPSNIFEFQKAERAAQRVPLAPFSKPAPSKWDDAQKWIASPTSNRPKTGQPLGPGGQVVGSRKFFGYGSRQPLMNTVMEVPDQRLVPFEEPQTKRIDSGQDNKEICGQKYLSWESDPYPDSDAYGKPELMIENCGGQSAINLSRHDSSMSLHSATTFIPPPSTARSVSMRDMGTEMTPIASQEPSRTGTPVRATTPMRSPASSRPSTPRRGVRSSSPTGVPNDRLDHKKEELSEKELQMRTRREIIRLGTQLGKMNIAAWASKEEEDKDASTSLKTLGVEQAAKSVIETRAAAWEEAEKAKYLARFKREELKIQAWENHQKAKAEAEMRKIEVEVERMRGKSHDKLMNKLAATSHKAEEKRAAADAKRNRQAAKTEQQAEHIRRTGRTPSSFLCCGWCL